MNLEKAKTFKGMLGKDSPSLFGGYQKRFFQIIEGNQSKGESFMMTYADKEGGTVKGVIPFNEISQLTSINKKEFFFMLGDRKFKLKADNEKEKNTWIEVINLIKEESRIIEEQMNDNLRGNKSRGDSMYSKGNKSWKIANQNKDVINTLSNQGVAVDQGKISSEKCIELKGLKPLLRGINPDLLKTRVKHGFLLKKHKTSTFYSQKRWLFLISSRPFDSNEQLYDEETVDNNSLPSSLKFDTLYYYSVDDENDKSTFKGELKMSECSRLSTKENDKEFYITIDMNDRIFEFSTEIGWERDSWFEALKNSKKTGKDIELSKTKRPRNMARLLGIYNDGNKSSIEKQAEIEINQLTVGFTDIKNHQILSALIKKIDTKLIQLVDGCLLCSPVPSDILKIYCEKFNAAILNKIQQYWKYLSENLSADQILDLIDIVYKQEDKLSDFGIEDPNFCLNGKELIKIFTRKVIMNLETLIESILKNEREYKALKSEQDDGDLLMTNGPVDLFRTFYKTFDMIKTFKIKDLHVELFKMFKECILLYLIGVDVVISRGDLVIDNEFLIGVCNNSIKLSSQISDFIEDAKSYSVLSEQEINNFIGQKSILKSLSFISETAMARLVFELCSPTLSSFITSNYFEIDIEKVVEEISQNLEAFVQFMHFSTQKKYWTEVLKATVYSYTKNVLNASMKKETIEDLRNKLEKDRQTFIESFVTLGKNQLEEETRIIEILREFLSSNIDMISFSCSNIKQKSSKNFNIKTAKMLINLRSDWSSSEKKEAIECCKEVLDKFESKAGDNKIVFHDEFFKQLHDELKKEQKLEAIEEDEDEEKNKNLKDVSDAIKSYGDGESSNNSTGKDNNSRRKTLFLDSFLEEIDNDEQEAENEQESEKTSSISRTNTFNRSETGQSLEEYNEVIKQGNLQKKSNKSWQDRYFQLKNNKLYWYQNKDSNMALNFIDLKNALKMPFSHKPGKFTLLAEKEYKFDCKTNDVCEEWIDAIKNEMMKIKNSQKVVQLFQLEMKKKIITMQGYNLPNIYSYKATMKNKVIKAMANENFFIAKTKKVVSLQPNSKIINQVDSKKRHSVMPNEHLFVKPHKFIEDPDMTIKEDKLESLNIEYNDQNEGNIKKGICSNCWDRFKAIFGLN